MKGALKDYRSENRRRPFRQQIVRTQVTAEDSMCAIHPPGSVQVQPDTAAWHRVAPPMSVLVHDPFSAWAPPGTGSVPILGHMKTR